MGQMVAGGLRIGAIALLGVVFTCAICHESRAENGERSSRHAPRQAVRDSMAAVTPPISPQAGVGKMRYYGGPKASMWREPASGREP